MTQCTRQRMLFSSVGRQKVEADFAGGRLSSDAGVLLLREMDRELGLIDALDGCIPDPRNPALITHPQRDLLAQRVFAIAQGYEDLNDHDALREDPAMQLATERTPDNARPLGSSPTLCRLENRVHRPTLVRLSEVLVEQFIASYDEPPLELMLDFDATDDLVHGKQEGRFFHGYYDDYCFLPLYVFCGDRLLVSYLRPSNIDASHHTQAILGLLVKRLRQAWPDVKITLRGDSGFCRWRLMRWCDRRGVGYILGLARNAVLQEMAADLMAQAEEQFQRTGEKVRLFGEFHYAAQTWDCPRRIIVKAERLVEGPNLRFAVTNLAGDPQVLYDDAYCPRGDMENRIKEQQLGLFADRTSCHAFEANQFRVLLAAAAYVLVEALRRKALAETELARAQVGTIRVKLLKLAARIVVTARRIVVHLPTACPLQDLFMRIVHRLVTHTLAAPAPG